MYNGYADYLKDVVAKGNNWNIEADEFNTNTIAITLGRSLKIRLKILDIILIILVGVILESICP